MVTKTRILILADDLTGANDTAIQFCKYGFSTLVDTGIAHTDTAIFKDCDVVSINTDSRSLSPVNAYQIVYQAVKKYEIAGNGLGVYKKVDSLLRGNPGQELAAVMEALEIPLALAAPAFPANRSLLKHGLLPSGANAVRIFANGSGCKTENIPVETIRQGARSIVAFIHSRNRRGAQVFVADAIDDNDLKTIYAASICLEKPHILAGSAGLANQLARKLGKEKEALFTLSPMPTLVVAGSRQAETATQIITLSQRLSIPIIRFRVSLVMEGKSDEAIKEAYNEAAELMRHTVPMCIVAVESMFHADKPYIEGNATGKAISVALGRLTGKLFDDFHFSLLVSTGGDTSMEVCKQLGISCLEPLQEIYPGIPLARIVGSAYNGRLMLTKSGRFGEADTLLKILKYAHE